MKNKIFVFSSIFMLLLLVFMITPSSIFGKDTVTKLCGETVHVVDDEGDGHFTTIQAAIDAANEGDTIKVFSGTYVENVVVDKRVNLIGNDTELGDGDDTGKPIVDGDNKGDVILITADQVYLCGFKVTNSAGYIGFSRPHNSIWINSNSNTITGNEITENNGRGITVANSKNNTISYNKISHNKGGYCQFRKCINTTIVGNTFIRNGIGISPISGVRGVMENDDDFTVYEFWDSLTIENNTVNGKPIYFYKNMSNFSVPTDAGQVILAGCIGVKVSGLTITNTDTGIKVWGCLDITISHNVIMNNLGAGIDLTNSSHCQIYNNIITYNSDGITIEYKSCDNLITKNDIRYNYANLILKYNTWKAGIVIMHCSRRNIVVNNNFVENGYIENAFDYSGDNEWDRNYWDRPRLLPKLIFYMVPLEKIPIAIRRLKDIDWHPAKQPYDIEV